MLFKSVFDNFFVSNKLKRKSFGNIFRLTLIYKFGGWYSDIDTIIMKPLTDFETKFNYKEDVLVSTDQFSTYMKLISDADGNQVTKP
jgi:hypothetical protein